MPNLVWPSVSKEEVKIEKNTDIRMYRQTDGRRTTDDQQSSLKSYIILMLAGN